MPADKAPRTPEQWVAAGLATTWPLPCPDVDVRRRTSTDMQLLLSWANATSADVGGHRRTSPNARRRSLNPQVRGSNPRGPTHLPSALSRWVRSVGANRGRIDSMTAKTVRVIDIAEILGVSHRRASKIVEMPDFPQADRPRGSEPPVGSARGRCVGKEWHGAKPWRRLLRRGRARSPAPGFANVPVPRLTVSASRAHIPSCKTPPGHGRYDTEFRGEEAVYQVWFEGPEVVEVPDGRVLTRTLDQVVAAVYSVSTSSPGAFGERGAAFESEPPRSPARHLRDRDPLARNR